MNNKTTKSKISSCRKSFGFSSKAQGLPLNLIILAIVAALVLVIILAFTVGGAGSIFSKIFKTGQTAIGDDLDTVRTTCQGYCDQAKLADVKDQPGQNYCKKEFDIDINKDNDLKDSDLTGKEIDLKCGDTEIGVTCPDVTCTVASV